MPAWVNSPAKEAAWQKAKEIVRKQRGKAEASFEDRDWGLVTHIAKNMLQSSVPHNEETQVLLAKVEVLLERRRIRAKRDKDSQLPEDVKALVEALSGVMAQGGQTIAALRSSKKTGISEEESAKLAEELRSTAERIKKLLEGVRE